MGHAAQTVGHAAQSVGHAAQSVGHAAQSVGHAARYFNPWITYPDCTIRKPPHMAKHGF